MAGAVAKSSDALAISAAATLPRGEPADRHHSNAEGFRTWTYPSVANHATVSGSSWTSGKALRRNASTSFSFPGLASSFTNSATVALLKISCFWVRFEGQRPSDQLKIILADRKTSSNSSSILRFFLNSRSLFC